MSEPTYEERLRDEAAMRILGAFYAREGPSLYPIEAAFLAEQAAAAWLAERRKRTEGKP